MWISAADSYKTWHKICRNPALPWSISWRPGRMTVIIPNGTRHPCGATELSFKCHCAWQILHYGYCVFQHQALQFAARKNGKLLQIFLKHEFPSLQDGRKLRPDFEALLFYLDKESLPWAIWQKEGGRQAGQVFRGYCGAVKFMYGALVVVLVDWIALLRPETQKTGDVASK